MSTWTLMGTDNGSVGFQIRIFSILPEERWYFSAMSQSSTNQVWCYLACGIRQYGCIQGDHVLCIIKSHLTYMRSSPSIGILRYPGSHLWSPTTSITSTFPCPSRDLNLIWHSPSLYLLYHTGWSYSFIRCLFPVSASSILKSSESVHFPFRSETEDYVGNPTLELPKYFVFAKSGQKVYTDKC